MNTTAIEATANGPSRLRRELSVLAVLMLTLSCLSPVYSIYGTGSDVLQHAGTGAALLFLVALVAAVIWALVCVALAIFNSKIASNMFYARIAFSVGRDEILPSRVSSWLGTIHVGTGVPHNATIAIGLATAACCSFSTHALVIFGAGLTTFTLGLVSGAVFVGRLKGLTGRRGYWRSPLFPLVPLMGIALTIVFLAAGLQDEDVGRPSVLLLAFCVGLALLWYRFALKPRGWRPRLD